MTRLNGSGLLPCGTPAAYRRHLDHREVPCAACTEAERIRLDDRRKAAARRAVLAEAVYTRIPRRGTQRARQAALLRGDLP